MCNESIKNSLSTISHNSQAQIKNFAALGGKVLKVCRTNIVHYAINSLFVIYNYIIIISLFEVLSVVKYNNYALINFI